MSATSSKKSKKKKDEYSGPNGVEDNAEKASKDEYKVAKWMRSNVPIKKTKFMNHNVEYFTSVKALDALMSSKFAQGDNCLFITRQSAVDFLDCMLTHKFFHRAKKVPVSELELKGRSKAKESSKNKSKDEKATDAESSHAEGKVDKGNEKNADKEKRKRKIRLEMHPQQLFVDGHEPFVWIYDPIPLYYWIFGTLLVVGAIVICLFPLWPPSLRKGVYYLSIAAAGFLVFLLGLVVVRFILFCAIWICTGGKHHFWFLPNLTEDVGFVASFLPLYKHEYRESADAAITSKKGKKKKRDKDSDAEEETQKPLLEKDEIENIKEHDAEEAALRQRNSPTKKSSVKNSPKPQKVVEAVVVEDSKLERKNSATSESESEGSQRSSTGKDFEMVDPEDVETS